jgi:hypothetical protein
MRIFGLDESESSRRLEKKTSEKGRDYLGDLSIDERILLTFLVRK